MTEPTEATTDPSVSKLSLFGEEGCDGEDILPASLGDVKVDKQYASRLLRRKREEELRLMRRKFGNEEDDAADLSTDETSDEDGYMLSDKKKIEIANLLEAVRSGNLDKLKQEQFYYESESGSSTDGGYAEDPKKKHKYTLKSQLWEALGQDDDLSKIDALARTGAQDQEGGTRMAFTPAGERQRTKEDFLAVVEEAEQGGGGWGLKERQPTPAALAAAAERDARFWGTRAGKALKRDIERRQTAKARLEGLLTGDPADSKAAFLRDYFVNDGWSWGKATEQDPTPAKPRSGLHPTKALSGGENEVPVPPDSSSDEEFLANQEVFEHAYEEYKYRHQDEGFTENATPAAPGPTVRRKESGRKKKQREAQAAKERDRERQFQEELARAKHLKRQELRAKASVLQELARSSRKRFSADVVQRLRHASLEEHDKLMAELFDDAYYNEEDDGDDFDADEEWDEERELQALMGSDCSREKRALLSAVFSDPTPKKAGGADKATSSTSRRALSKETAQRQLEEEAQHVQQELEELGHEDVIANGEIRCRFKYRKIEPFRFPGLDETDILVLPDATLDAVAPMRYLANQRTPQERERDRRAVAERLKRLGPVDYGWKVGSKRYRQPTGIDPATWDELQQKLEALKAEKAAQAVQPPPAVPGAQPGEEEGYAGDTGEASFNPPSPAEPSPKRQARTARDHHKAKKSRRRGRSAPAPSGETVALAAGGPATD